MSIATLSQMLAIENSRSYRFKELRWPHRQNRHTNKVEKSKNYKSSRSLLDNHNQPQNTQNNIFTTLAKGGDTLRTETVSTMLRPH